jgi:hypothetical protein
MVANHYGTVGLVRRSLLLDGVQREDPWPLYARLSLGGATIVSVPRVLASVRKEPGDVDRDPAAALEVVRHFDLQLPHGLNSLARLAAGLAAMPTPATPPRRGVLRRILRRL